MSQILILLQSIRQPVNVLQTKYFKISDPKPLQKLTNRIYEAIGQGENDSQCHLTGKPSFKTSTHMQRILYSDQSFVSL